MHFDMYLGTLVYHIINSEVKRTHVSPNNMFSKDEYAQNKNNSMMLKKYKEKRYVPDLHQL